MIQRERHLDLRQNVHLNPFSCYTSLVISIVCIDRKLSQFIDFSTGDFCQRRTMQSDFLVDLSAMTFSLHFIVVTMPIAGSVSGAAFLCIVQAILLLSPSPTSLSESFVPGQPALFSHCSTDTLGLTDKA